MTALHSLTLPIVLLAVAAAGLLTGAVVLAVDGRRQERRKAERRAQRDALPFPFGPVDTGGKRP